MVPSSLTLIILVVGFFPASFAYLFSWPKRRLMNPYFAVLAAIGGLMLFTLITNILRIQIIWLSWVLLVAGLFLVPSSMKLLQVSREGVRERDRQNAERRARGG